MTFEYYLQYRYVNPDLELEAIHSVFFEDDMDVLIGCGRLKDGQLALTVSVEDADAANGLDRALRTARRGMGDGQLMRVGPDVEDLREIGFLTELPAADLKTYAQQPWFPAPKFTEKTFPVDEVVRAIQVNAEVPVDLNDALVASVRAARAVNELLMELNG